MASLGFVCCPSFLWSRLYHMRLFACMQCCCAVFCIRVNSLFNEIIKFISLFARWGVRTTVGRAQTHESAWCAACCSLLTDTVTQWCSVHRLKWQWFSIENQHCTWTLHAMVNWMGKIRIVKHFSIQSKVGRKHNKHLHLIANQERVHARGMKTEREKCQTKSHRLAVKVAYLSIEQSIKSVNTQFQLRAATLELIEYGCNATLLQCKLVLLKYAKMHEKARDMLGKGKEIDGDRESVRDREIETVNICNFYFMALLVRII